MYYTRHRILKERPKTQNLQIIDIITESKSAKLPYNRPLFESMLTRIEAGEANGILCWHVNRLSRNPIDSGRISWNLQMRIKEMIFDEEF